MNFREQLQTLVDADVEEVVRKDAEYDSSWKARGGVGAFMQGIARKWDRIEKQVKDHGYDLFAAIKADTRPEGILDDLGDLARYCLLIRAEAASWGHDNTTRYVTLTSSGGTSMDLTGMDHPHGYPGEEDDEPPKAA